MQFQTLLRFHLVVATCCALSLAQGQTDEQDSLILVEIFDALNGLEWDVNTGWLDNTVDAWYGVTVENGRVTRVNLQGNNLAGTFPENIVQLTELRELSIAVNDINGEMPSSISNLAKLQILSISKNEFEGLIPGSIALLTELDELNLLSNNFTGPLPDMSSLQNLEVVYFDNNDLSGPFPEWLLDMPALRVLGLRNVGLTGKVPPTIFKSFPQLEVLRLGSNALEGDISEWFKDTSPVQSFEIYNNAFTGKMANGVIDPDISDFTISRNLIEAIPDFSDATELKTFFYIDDNKLDFSEISKADSVSTFSPDRMALGPQKMLLSRDTIVSAPGDDVTIQSGSYHDMDSYQWYMNGSILTGADESELSISDYQTSNAGEYHCVISNPGYAFELEREHVVLVTDNSTSTRAVNEFTFSISPNPASDYITISDVHVATWTITDLSGQTMSHSNGTTIDISHLPSGIYNIAILAQSGALAVQKFVKM